MEWYIMNSSGVRSLTAGIGERTADGSYKIHDECSETLDELLEKIEVDSLTDSVTKRHLLAERFVEKDLAPMIKYAAPDISELQLTLRLLTKLCQTVDEETKSLLKENVSADLDKLSTQTCQLFEDDVFVKKLLCLVQELIQEAGNREMASEGYGVIENLLALVTEVLTVSQSRSPDSSRNVTHLMLRNDFSAILVFCITCHARDTFAPIVSRILSLLYAKFQWMDDDNISSDEDPDSFICDKLKCLIVQLLQGPLEELVVTLKRRELSDSALISFDNYLAWCVAYFLPYLSKVPVPVTKFRKVLSSKFFGYLVYQASMLSVELMNHNNNKDHLRHSNNALQNSIYVVFSALDAVISQAISYPLQSLSIEECQILIKFYADLVEMKELWEIILLYIRCHDLVGFSRSFLIQLICLNHKLLSAVNYHNELTSKKGSSLLEHVKQFASPQLVNQYTLLLESYESNSSETNMAVCTMLCHICTDCDRIDALYTAPLLRALSRLIPLPTASKDDKQLAEFVTDSFIDDLSKRPELCVNSFLADYGNSQTFEWPQPHRGEPMACSGEADWSEEELYEMHSCYTNWHGSGDIVKIIVGQLSNSGFNRSREEVSEQLERSGLLAEQSYVQPPQADEIEKIVLLMCGDDNEDVLHWIHSALLTASYVRAMPRDHCSKRSPLSHFSQIRHHACPILPCNEKQEKALRSDCHTKRLLQCLKLYGDASGQLGEESEYLPGHIPRIPSTLAASDLYVMAEKIYAVGIAPFEKESVHTSSSSSEEELTEKLKFSQFDDAPHSSQSHLSMSTPNLSNVWLYHMQNKPSS